MDTITSTRQVLPGTLIDHVITLEIDPNVQLGFIYAYVTINNGHDMYGTPVSSFIFFSCFIIPPCFFLFPSSFEQHL